MEPRPYHRCLIFWTPGFTVVFSCGFTDHLKYVLDYMRPPPPACGPTHTSIVSITLHPLPDWGRRLTQTSVNFLPYNNVHEAKDWRVW